MKIPTPMKLQTDLHSPLGEDDMEILTPMEFQTVCLQRFAAPVQPSPRKDSPSLCRLSQHQFHNRPPALQNFSSEFLNPPSKLHNPSFTIRAQSFTIRLQSCRIVVSQSVSRVSQSAFRVAQSVPRVSQSACRVAQSQFLNPPPEFHNPST